MIQDRFTKALKRIMRSYGKEYGTIADSLTEVILQYILKGDTVAEAYKKAIRKVDFFGLNSEAIEKAVYEASIQGYGIEALSANSETLKRNLMNVPWTSDGVKLTTRLRGVNRVLRSNITDTVSNSMRAYKSIQKTVLALHEQYDFPEKVLNEEELQKYLSSIKALITKLYLGDKKAAKNSNIYKVISKDTKTIKSPIFRSAYRQALKEAGRNNKRLIAKAKKMLASGKSKKEVAEMLESERKTAIENALRVAVHKKAKYYAERIARTESARAYYEAQLAEANNDTDIFGFKWVLSTAHVHAKEDCDCDMYANADIGYGKGVYPKDKVPSLPAHPNCMCHLRKIYSWEVEKTGGTDKVPKQRKRINRVEESN